MSGISLPLFLKGTAEKHSKELNVSMDTYFTLALMWFIYCDPNHSNDFIPESEIGDPNTITLQEARTALLEAMKTCFGKEYEK